MLLEGISLEQIDIDLDEIQSESIEDIATAKAQAAYAACGKPVVVEDSGFYIDAFNGFPGPLIKYLELAMGQESVLKLLGDNQNRRAHARAVAAYCDGEKTVLGMGQLDGEISHTLRGDTGFFFDYFFIPDGFDQTCAELGLKEKIKISHRTRAFQDLLDKLQ